VDTILQELRQGELAFHQAELCATREALERYADPEFWEVGASGTVYTRETVITIVEERFRTGTEADTSEWEVREFAGRELGPETYMVTYILRQGDRLSRRMSVWRHVDGAWRILYHQGTLSASVQTGANGPI
jgi:hypothetical protein